MCVKCGHFFIRSCKYCTAVSLQTEGRANFERERWPSRENFFHIYPFPNPNELSELQRCSAVQAFQRKISQYILKTLECQDIRQWCWCWQKYYKIIFYEMFQDCFMQPYNSKKYETDSILSVYASVSCESSLQKTFFKKNSERTIPALIYTLIDIICQLISDQK